LGELVGGPDIRYSVFFLYGLTGAAEDTIPGTGGARHPGVPSRPCFLLRIPREADMVHPFPPAYPASPEAPPGIQLGRGLGPPPFSGTIKGRRGHQLKLNPSLSFLGGFDDTIVWFHPTQHFVAVSSALCAESCTAVAVPLPLDFAPAPPDAGNVSSHEEILSPFLEHPRLKRLSLAWTLLKGAELFRLLRRASKRPFFFQSTFCSTGIGVGSFFPLFSCLGVFTRRPLPGGIRQSSSSSFRFPFLVGES